MVLSEHELDRLRFLPLFHDLPEEVIRSLLSGANVRNYAKRAPIFEQGETASHFYVVLSGWVRIFRLRPDGAEVVIEIFGPGESFAEGAMYMPDGYPVSAEMVAEGRLLAIRSDGYLDRMRREPDLALKMLSSMAVRLKQFVNRIETMTSQSASQRVAAFLLKFCPQPTGPARSAEIQLPYDKQLIANRLGMKPETFSRALSDLREQGVSVKGGNARVADTAALRRFSLGD